LCGQLQHGSSVHSTHPERAWISRYAWGRDYHDTLQEKLRELARWMEENAPAKTRTYVDTGPLTERVFARYAGIGWFGKNTCIINQQAGSWLFLGCVLTDLELTPDTPPPDRCGSCTRCLDACPTDAFVAPYVLDSESAFRTRRLNCAARFPNKTARESGITSSDAISVRTCVRGIDERRQRQIRRSSRKTHSTGRSSKRC
jgi:epoxyqueuosine reductase